MHLPETDSTPVYTLQHAKAVVGDRVLEDATMVIRDGKITGIGGWRIIPNQGETRF